MWSSDRNNIIYFKIILKRIVKEKFQKFGEDTIILSTPETIVFQNLIPHLIYMLFRK